MNEETKFDYFMKLADTYFAQHPNREHFFNYFQWVDIDNLINALENANGRIIEVKFDYPKSGQIIFNGFEYVEEVSV